MVRRPGCQKTPSEDQEKFRRQRAAAPFTADDAYGRSPFKLTEKIDLSLMTEPPHGLSTAAGGTQLQSRIGRKGGGRTSEEQRNAGGAIPWLRS